MSQLQTTDDEPSTLMALLASSSVDLSPNVGSDLVMAESFSMEGEGLVLIDAMDENLGAVSHLEGHSSVENDESGVLRSSESSAHPLIQPPPPPFMPTPDKPGRLTNQLKFMKTVLLDVWDHPSANPFCFPVEISDAPGYYDEIKNPMDLNTIWERLEHNYYWSAEECVADFKLMFENCYKYNPPGDPTYNFGKVVEEYFTKLLREMPMVEREVQEPKGRKAAKKGRGSSKKKFRASPPVKQIKEEPKEQIRSSALVPVVASHMNDMASSQHCPAPVVVGHEHFQDQPHGSPQSFQIVLPTPDLSVYRPMGFAQPVAGFSAAPVGQVVVPSMVLSRFPTSHHWSWLNNAQSDSKLMLLPNSENVADNVLRPVHISGARAEAVHIGTSAVPLSASHDPRQACSRIIDVLMSEEHSGNAQPFRSATQDQFFTRGDNRIKDPRDLESIKAKLDSGGHKKAKEFGRDVRQMFGNAYRCMHENSDAIRKALNLQHIFEYLYAKMPEDEESASEAPLEEKRTPVFTEADMLNRLRTFQTQLKAMTTEVSDLVAQSEMRLKRKKRSRGNKRAVASSCSEIRQADTTTLDSDIDVVKKSVEKKPTHKPPAPRKSKGNHAPKKSSSCQLPSSSTFAVTSSAKVENPAGTVNPSRLSSDEKNAAFATMSYDQLSKLSSDLQRLPPEKWAGLLEIVKEEVPVGSDLEISLDVGSLKPMTVCLLANYVETCLKEQKQMTEVPTAKPQLEKNLCEMNDMLGIPSNNKENVALGAERKEIQLSSSDSSSSSSSDSDSSESDSE